MDSYLEIRVIPNPELSKETILSSVYSKLHQILVQSSCESIGVSFPKHTENNLGDTIRLHGSEDNLTKLLGLRWFSQYSDYLDVTEVKMVPSGSQYRSVFRVQAKSNPARLRRRAMKRHQLTLAQATEKIPDSCQEVLSLPHLKMRSDSTKQQFPMFIRHGPLGKTRQEGNFNSYGLSAKTTIPWF